MRRGCIIGAVVAGIILALAAVVFMTTLGREVASTMAGPGAPMSDTAENTSTTIDEDPNEVIYCDVLHDRAPRSQCAYYAEIWSKLEVGAGGIRVPSSIARGETETVSFAISRDENAAPLTDALGGRPDTSVKLKIGRLMAAQLQGDGFRVEPGGLQQKDLFLGDTTRWDWQVTPLRAPKYRLVLSAYVVVRAADGSQKESLLKTLELPLPVTVTWGQRISDFMDDSLDWLTRGTNWLKALTAFLLALGGLFAIFRTKEKPDGE